MRVVTADEAARLRLRHAALLKNQGRPIIREAAEARLLASELAVPATRDALQIHGAYGYSKDFPIERMYRGPSCTRSLRGRARSSVWSSLASR